MFCSFFWGKLISFLIWKSSLKNLTVFGRSGSCGWIYYWLYYCVIARSRRIEDDVAIYLRYLRLDRHAAARDDVATLSLHIARNIGLGMWGELLWGCWSLFGTRYLWRRKMRHQSSPQSLHRLYESPLPPQWYSRSFRSYDW